MLHSCLEESLKEWQLKKRNYPMTVKTWIEKFKTTNDISSMSIDRILREAYYSSPESSDTFLYALRFKDTKELIGVSYEFGMYMGECFSLDYLPSSTGLWVTTNYDVAENAMNSAGDWSRTTYFTPVNRFVGQLEIVKIGVVK